MKINLWMVGLAVAAIVFIGFSVHVAHQRDAWQHATDSLTVVVDQRTKAAKAAELRAAADSAKAVIAAVASDQHKRASDSLLALLHQSPKPGPVPADNAPAEERVTYWQQRAVAAEVRESLAYQAEQQQEQRGDSLQAAFDHQKQATAELMIAKHSSDSSVVDLTAQLHRAPKACKRVPLLGIPMPRVVAGPSVSPTAPYVQPFAVTVGIPIGGC